MPDFDGPFKESVGNKKLKLVGNFREDPKPEPSAKEPLTKKTPCVGNGCTKLVDPVAPWGRIFFGDGEYGGACGSKCNRDYFENRWNGKSSQAPVPLLQDAAD